MTRPNAMCGGPKEAKYWRKSSVREKSSRNQPHKPMDLKDGTLGSRRSARLHRPKPRRRDGQVGHARVQLNQWIKLSEPLRQIFIQQML